jgi:hypothetical protein
MAAIIAAISSGLRMARNHFEFRFPNSDFPKSDLLSFTFVQTCLAGVLFMVLSPGIDTTKVGLGLETLGPDHFWP